MNIISPRPRTNQLKELAEMQRWVRINVDRPRNENQQAIIAMAGLDVRRFDCMFDCAEGFEFFDDCRVPCSHIPFEGHATLWLI